MSIFIKALSFDDWRAFQAVRLEALKAYPQYFSLSYAEEAAYDREKIQEFWLSGGNKCVFGLFEGDELIGITGVFTWREDASGKTGIMGASYIRPAFQGRGYSKLLYKARIDWALGHKAWDRLVVGHRDGNERSRRANQAWGFVFTHKNNRSWPDGTVGDEWSYEMDLVAARQREAK